jgi:hypothetical protein
MEMEISIINDILNDLWNFHLVLIGITLSVFILLYSFIISKRDDLKSISEQIKYNGTNPILTQKENFAIKYIQRLRKINKNCIYIFIISSVLCCGSWIALRIIKDDHIILKQVTLLAIGVLTITLCMYMAFQFLKIYRQYNSETKI